MTDHLISDVHLYPEGRSHPGRKLLEGYLAGLGEETPGNLWILGDLFDYWFEYRGLVPSGYTGLCCLLRNLSGSGWNVRFLPGNHDWWCGKELRRATGMELIRESPYVTDIQGIRCVLAHGDGLGHGDTGYRIMKPILRSPFSVFLFSLLHPSVATFLATRFSGTSKRILRRKIEEVPAHLAEWVESQDRRGAALVVTGHTHCPSLTRRGNVLHASLGDWISHFTYLTVREGEISLNEYSA